MKAKIHSQIMTLFAVLVSIPASILPCYPEIVQRQPKKPTPQPSAPFLQYVKSYEETTYVTKVVLKNGMTVLANEFKTQPVVSIQMYIRAGYFSDPTDAPGTARLLAEIIQRGAPDKNTIRQKINALGSMLNVETDYGTTLFEVVAPSNQWKRALGIQADAILNPSINPREIGAAAKIVEDKARAVLDQPVEGGEEKILQLAFNQPAMGKSSALAGGKLANYTPESLAGFYKAQYTPSKMMLVISGDVISGEVLNEVVRIYTKPSGALAKPATIPFPPNQNSFRFNSVRGDLALPDLYFGFHTVPENNEDYRPLEILKAVLGMGEASIINSQLRDQKKLILSGDCESITGPEFGFLILKLKVNPANIDKTEIAALTEIELLKRDELLPADLERAIAQLERSYWAGLETVSGKARVLARFEYLGDWKRMDRYVSDLRKVKAADVKRVAVKYLRQDNCSLLEHLPAGEDRTMSAEGAQRNFEALVNPSADQEQQERGRKTVLAVDSPPPSGSFKYSEIRYPFQTASILRGPDLLIREDHTNPLIQMGLFFPGGKLSENKKNAGITKLLTRVMMRGTADPIQLQRQLDVYGARVIPVVADDYFGFNISVLSQNFEPAFKLLLESMRSPVFEKDVLARQQEIQLSEIRSRNSSDAYAQELMDRLLFGEHPYAFSEDGTESSVAAITPEVLSAWYADHVKNRKPTVVLIGDTKGTSLASVFVQHFSGSRFQESKISGEFVKPLEKGASEENTWNKAESLILIGFQAPPEDDEDGLAVHLLQGYAGGPGKLSQELVDRLAIAHRVSVVYQPHLRGGSLVICAAANPRNEESVLKAVQEQMQQMNTDPITFQDFRAAVNQATGSYAIQQQDRSVQIETIALKMLSGKGINGYRAYPAGLQELGEEDLQGAIRKLIRMEKAVVVRMHGKK